MFFGKKALSCFVILGTFITNANVANAHGTVLQQVMEQPKLQKLSELLSSNDYKFLADTLNNTSSEYTLFAPDDDAINEAVGLNVNDVTTVTNVFSYHVVKGLALKSSDLKALQFPPTLLNGLPNVILPQNDTQVLVVAKTSNNTIVIRQGGIPDATVIGDEIVGHNGVVHIIDRVLSIPVSVAETNVQPKNNWTTFQQNADTTGLRDEFDTAVGITLFVPNNPAFDDVSDIFSALSKDQLASVLRYHAVEGTVVYSSDFSDGMKLTTANGKDVVVHVDSDSRNITVNRAPVVKTNVLTRNGVIHVLGKVMNDTNATSGQGDNSKLMNPHTQSAAVATFAIATTAFSAVLTAALVLLLIL